MLTILAKIKIGCFSLTNPRWGLVNHTEGVPPKGQEAPKGAGRKKKTRRQFWPKSRLKWPKLLRTRVRTLNVA